MPFSIDTSLPKSSFEALSSSPNDPKIARSMVKAKERLRTSEQEATANHFARLRDAIAETIATSALHVDIIRDYRRVNTHMCSIAYDLLEDEGELVDTRLKPSDK